MRGCLRLALLSLLLCGTPTQAQMLADSDRIIFRTGEDLFADCIASEGHERGLCFGYVMAIADVMAGAGARVDGLRACHEEAESIEQLVGIVTEFLEANPAGRSIKADGLVAYALSLEFPCAPG